MESQVNIKELDRRNTLSPAIFDQLYAIHQVRGLRDFENSWKETLAHVIHMVYISEVVRSGAIVRINPFPSEVVSSDATEPEPELANLAQPKPSMPTLPMGLNLKPKA